MSLVAWFTSFLSGVATQFPLLIVWGAGFGIAVSRWNKHPKISRLAAGAYGFLIVLNLGATLFTSTLPFWLYDSGIDSRMISWVYTAIYLSESIAAAAANAVLLAAVFSDRPEPGATAAG